MKLKKDFQNFFNFSKESDEYKSLYSKISDLEYECTIMIRYISSLGKEIPDKIFDELSPVSVFVNSRNTKGKEEASEETLGEMFKEVMIIHNDLNVLSKPANAVSIRYTETNRGFFLKKNPVINAMMLFTLIFLVGYIIIKVVPEMSEAARTSLLIVSASGLGAGFYTLLSARRYLINRSYNPRYNPAYAIRFLLGLAAGSILAFMFSDYFEEYKYSIEILAVVGGFSSDAVGVILKRISEVLIATFKGISDDDSAQQELMDQKEMIAKKKARVDGLEEIAKLKSEVLKIGAPPEVLKVIEDSYKDFAKN